MPWASVTKTSLLLLGFVLSLFLGAWIFFIHSTWTETKVVFLSIGEGDAILLTHGDYQVLIDSSRDGKRLLEHLGKFIPFYDHTIEVVIETHPDADHIGGFPDLLKRYQVKNFLRTGAKSDTDTVRLLDQILADSKETTIIPAFLGTHLDLRDGGGFDILYPHTPLPEIGKDTNSGSVVARYQFGQTSFLFTGDLPSEEEYVPHLDPVTVLKVAHHGSHFSTDDLWLDEIRPRDAVISVGPNTYGHPSPEVMERLSKRGIHILRTDTMGDIVYRCRVAWDECRSDQ